MSFRLAGNDLGQSFEVLGALSDLGELVGNDPGYEELLGVVDADDQDVSDGYLSDVRRQANRLLAERGGRATRRARALLQRLSTIQPDDDEVISRVSRAMSDKETT